MSVKFMEVPIHSCKLVPEKHKLYIGHPDYCMFCGEVINKKIVKKILQKRTNA